MKRRSFLSISALSAVPVAARAAGEEPDAGWWETTNEEALVFKASTEEGKITLEVELFRPAEDEVTERQDPDGPDGAVEFIYQGKVQPYPFYPGNTLLKRFDLTWDGKDMKIPERFWNDLPGLRIQTSSLDPEKVPPEIRWKAEQFLEGLRQPRVSLSAEGGTVLIEWERGEECDSHSTIRWIVSKSGVVLRHRHCPPHEC
jgi:hypothetical protein